MSRAAGAAASTPKPPCSIRTTTTTFGLYAGAHDAYQEWSLPVGVSAVPVLPATGIGKFPKIADDVPVGECAAEYRPARIAHRFLSLRRARGLNRSFFTSSLCGPSPARATCGRTPVPP